MSTVTRAVQVSGPGKQLELVEREIPRFGRGEVLVRVEACGVCHSDTLTVEGGLPGIEYPRVPGHEIAGRIEATGDDSFPWEVGQRVGVGWFGGNCGYCDPCRRGDMISCTNGRVPGLAYDGGYAAYVLARAERSRQAANIETRRKNLLRKELAWLRRGPPARTSKPKFRIDAAKHMSPADLAAMGAALRRLNLGDEQLMAGLRKRLGEFQRSDGGWDSDEGPTFDVNTTLTAIRACHVVNDS